MCEILICYVEVNWMFFIAPPQASNSPTNLVVRGNLLAEKYPATSLFVAAVRHCSRWEQELSVAAGQSVAVIKFADPSGNNNNWFVDDGGGWQI